MYELRHVLEKVHALHVPQDELLHHWIDFAAESMLDGTARLQPRPLCEGQLAQQMPQMHYHVRPAAGSVDDEGFGDDQLHICQQLLFAMGRQ